ncbi:hypothetical protein L9F63_007515 [Diploptera punctata]|uniref:Uncharacterized protein n=1 Tax=Diploptera punctata TaxID=6984 RepID=A0AAD7Z889_DIPPU|nr:hypothetical protein L9F63_007515 [Diploptera punctata]
MKLTIPFAVLLVLLVQLENVCCSRDGFNMYKDLLLRGKVDGVDDTSDQLGPGEVPSIPKLYFYRTPMLAPHADGLDYMIGREPLDGTLESVDSESNSDGSPKSNVLRDRFSLPRTIVKRDVPGRYTYTGANMKSGDYQNSAILEKRGPGSILTWALSAKRPLLQSDIRHPGVGGPTSFIATMGKRHDDSSQ